jgi:hypothetical protein
MPYAAIDDRDDRKPKKYGALFGASGGARTGVDQANVGEVPGRGGATRGGVAGRTRHSGEPGRGSKMRTRALDELERNWTYGRK